MTPDNRRSHNDCTMRDRVACFWSPPELFCGLLLELFSDGTTVTGSLMTPQVLRIGPEGRRGALLSGLTAGGGGVCFRSLLAVGFLSLAALRRSPSDPARLKSKHVRSAWSPRNLAICGFERNFLPHGLEGK